MDAKIDNILPFVRKPLRYLGGEWNSSGKGMKDVNVCLCFPDLYELASSNMGIEILYHIINGREDASCERCYCPDFDMEERMTAADIPLSSLETVSPLRDFDIIGFSLQYELCFSNVLLMLELAGIPLESREREDIPSLVIGGGPVCVNPEPVADFFDMFVLGDGEEVIHEIIDTVRDFRKKRGVPAGGLKRELLGELARLEGVYVPSFYSVSRGTDGRISGITAGAGASREAVTTRTVPLSRENHPISVIVPYLDAVHDRFNVEISRGCRNSCRFCQAASVYSPWRERDPGEIMDILKKGVEATGYDEVSLMSFSSTDYSRMEELLEEVSEYSYMNNVFVSVPSLRCNAKTAGLLKYLTGPRRANLTFGVETGSDRLRKYIGKNICNDEILSTLKTAAELGWKQVKLYFMYGLPSEKYEDLEEIIRLVKRARSLSGSLRVNMTASPFVPKPHTAFQWVKQEDTSALAQKLRMLTARVPGRIRPHALEMSLLEGVFARGDRRLGKVIRTARRKGCRFDHWKEKFRFDLWAESFSENGMDMESYTGERDYGEILPWDHLSTGRTKEQLYRRYEQAKSGS